MATWGQFIAEIPIIKVKPGVIHVLVDDVMTLWEERNNLRAEVARLKSGGAHLESVPPASAPNELHAEIDRLRAAVLNEREACAREVEELAEAFLQEQCDQTEYIVTVLKATASLIREREAPEESVPMAETVENVAVEIPLAMPVEERTTSTETTDATPPLAFPVESESPPLAHPVETPTSEHVPSEVPHPEFRFE